MMVRVVILAAISTLLPLMALGGGQFMLIGSRVTEFEQAPVVDVRGRVFISLAVLDQLGGNGQPGAGFSMSAGDDEMPLPGDGESGEHHNPERDGSSLPSDVDAGLESVVELLEPDSIAPPLAEGYRRYPLAANVLDVSSKPQLSAMLNGEPLEDAQLMSWKGQGYISAAVLERVGLELTFNHQEQLYQLLGLIHKVEYRKGEHALVLSSLTPLKLSGTQDIKEDEEDLPYDPKRPVSVTVAIEGGFFPERQPLEFPGDDYVTRVGFKSQLALGRSFMFLKQPGRSGFRTQSDPQVGFAKVKLGNYFQVASYNLSSSGEISLNVQMGAPCEISHELIANPPRLVLDFPCAIYDEATQTIPVNQGHVEAIRVGQPENGAVRVVLDLSQQLDYRVLSKDDGARYFFQLFPSAPAIATEHERRKGRVIMLDAGHGGSDPGAKGVVAGVWEEPIALAITRYTAGELERMGYTVLETRTDDRFVSLGSRADYANSVLPYVFVSIHCNSLTDPNYSGPISFYYKGSVEGAKLATLIQSEIVAATGAVDKGTRDWGDFFVLRETVMPSVLVEAGFLTNKAECTNLANPAYQKKVAAGIARGIDSYVTGQ